MVMKRTTFFLAFEDYKTLANRNKQLNLDEETEITVSGRIRQIIKKFIKENNK